MTIGQHKRHYTIEKVTICPEESFMSQHEYLQRPKAIADLNAIALRALAALLAGSDTGCADMKVQQILQTAAVDKDWACFDRVVADLIEAGSSVERIANVHTPAVARNLGQGWMDGTQSFSTVSVGCARLQAYLRQKGLDWCDAQALQSTTGTNVLLVVPEYEQHTLGATLLAGQLRAHGVDVTFALRCNTLKLGQFTRNQSFDAILISASQSEALETLCQTILHARREGTMTPVILGGSVLSQIPNIREAAGADFIAHCVEDVIDLLEPVAATKRCVGA